MRPWAWTTFIRPGHSLAPFRQLSGQSLTLKEAKALAVTFLKRPSRPTFVAQSSRRHYEFSLYPIS